MSRPFSGDNAENWLKDNLKFSKLYNCRETILSPTMENHLHTDSLLSPTFENMQ